MIPEETIEEAFKNYDIRAKAAELTDEFCYAVANAYARHQNLTRCLVGRDVRKSSPRLAKAITDGLTSAGCDVILGGVMSTTQTKWAVAEHELEAGIMITASHNPPEDNGLKFYLEGGRPFGEDDGLHELKALLEHPATGGEGAVDEHSYAKEYATAIAQHLPSTQREVFLDPSGGAACNEAKLLAEHGNYNFTLYNAQEDPDFTAHSPNPLSSDAQETAKEYCAVHECIGAVLDADSDRVILIDEEGRAVPADFLGAFLADKLLAPERGIVITVRDSRANRDVAAKKGAPFHLSPVGNVHVQRHMIEEGLRLGVEKSGHLFFEEMHGCEAPLLCILLVLKHLDGTLADAIKPYREQYLCSEEHNYRVTDKRAVLDAAKDRYAEKGELVLIDGVLCEAEDWWVSVRASNTQPLMRVTWEARDKATYDALEREARELIEPFVAE